MRSFLRLTDNQVEAIGLIMTNQMTSAKTTREQRIQPEAAEESDPESEIKAILTPEQLAAYPEYQKSEKSEVAGLLSRSLSGELASGFDLTPEKEEALASALYEVELQPANPDWVAKMNQAKVSGNKSDFVNLTLEFQKSKIEQRAKVIEPFLTAEQLAAYRDQQNMQMDHFSKRMKTAYSKEQTSGDQ
jgi:hypothetical protein